MTEWFAVDRPPLGYVAIVGEDGETVYVPRGDVLTIAWPEGQEGNDG